MTRRARLPRSHVGGANLPGIPAERAPFEQLRAFGRALISSVFSFGAGHPARDRTAATGSPPATRPHPPGPATRPVTWRVTMQSPGGHYSHLLVLMPPGLECWTEIELEARAALYDQHRVVPHRIHGVLRHPCEADLRAMAEADDARLMLRRLGDAG